MGDIKQMAEMTTDPGDTNENFIRHGKVFILGPFDRSISSNVIPNLIELINIKKREKNPEIEIYINSRGGFACELFSLLALIEMAKKNGIKIVTYNLGVAYSCGSLLAIHGDKRKMYRFADNVMHLGSAGDSYSTMEQVDRVYRHTKEHFNNIIKMYSEHTKMTKKQVEEFLKDDKLHLSAEQCLKYGICDEII